MSLKKQIEQDYILAFKAKQTLVKDVLGGVKAKITEAEKAKKVESLSDDDVLTAITALVKQRQQTITAYESHVDKTEDKATLGTVLSNLEKEKAELEVLQSYLPQQLTDEEINTYLTKVLASSSVPASAKIGVVMKYFKENFNGRYDAKALKGMLDRLPK